MLWKQLLTSTWEIKPKTTGLLKNSSPVLPIKRLELCQTNKNVENGGVGRRHSTEVAFILLIQLPRVRFSAFPEIYFFWKYILSMLLRLIDSTTKDSSGQRRSLIVDQTHLVLLDSTTKNELHRQWLVTKIKNKYIIKTNLHHDGPEAKSERVKKLFFCQAMRSIIWSKK